MSSDRFIDLKFNRRNLDVFLVRSSIYNALKENLNFFNGDFLDVGCGQMAYREFIMENSSVKKYVGLDIENAIDYGGPKPDVVWDGNKMPLADESFDCVMATEVFEHCPDPGKIMAEIYRVLKPGGVLFFTVPFLWPLHEIPHDEYRYTPFALKRILAGCGFDDIDLKALGGWDASLAQMMGLWIKRRKISNIFLRSILLLIFMPVMKLLIKLDRKPDNFDKGYMITGITGIVKKK